MGANEIEIMALCRVGRGASGTYRCLGHGGIWTDMGCPTQAVLDDVAEERSRQYHEHGTNETLEDGTGATVPWLKPSSEIDAKLAEVRFRLDYENREERHGKPTWMHILREEIAEVFMESDPTRLREELIQVAAVAVSWVEKIDGRVSRDER